MLFDALLDKNIVPSSGSVNPFTNGALVNAPNRSYRIMVLPYGVASPAANIKSISMPPLPTGSTSMLTTLVLRLILLSQVVIAWAECRYLLLRPSQLKTCRRHCRARPLHKLQTHQQPLTPASLALETLPECLSLQLRSWERFSFTGRQFPQFRSRFRDSDSATL